MDRLGREGRRAEQVLVALTSLSSVCDGGQISELDHALQVATRAERSGADDELILAALLHDVGKIFGDAGHGDISADVLTPHVRADLVAVVRHHQAFTARHWDLELVGDRDPRRPFEGMPWYQLAATFVDDWDMRSFDPTYDHQPLEHFAPLICQLVTGS